MIASQVVTGGEVDPAPAELGHAGAGGFSNDTFMLNTARCVHEAKEAKQSNRMRVLAASHRLMRLICNL